MFDVLLFAKLQRCFFFFPVLIEWIQFHVRCTWHAACSSISWQAGRRGCCVKICQCDRMSIPLNHGGPGYSPFLCRAICCLTTINICWLDVFFVSLIVSEAFFYFLFVYCVQHSRSTLVGGCACGSNHLFSSSLAILLSEPLYSVTG